MNKSLDVLTLNLEESRMASHTFFNFRFAVIAALAVTLSIANVCAAFTTPHPEDYTDCTNLPFRGFTGEKRGTACCSGNICVPGGCKPNGAEMTANYPSEANPYCGDDCNGWPVYGRTSITQENLYVCEDGRWRQRCSKEYIYVVDCEKNACAEGSAIRRGTELVLPAKRDYISDCPEDNPTPDPSPMKSPVGMFQ